MQSKADMRNIEMPLLQKKVVDFERKIFRLLTKLSLENIK